MRLLEALASMIKPVVAGARSYRVAPYGSDLYPHSHNKLM